MKSFLLCERFSPQTGLFPKSWSALEREAYDSLSLSATSDAICDENKWQTRDKQLSIDVTLVQIVWKSKLSHYFISSFLPQCIQQAWWTLVSKNGYTYNFHDMLEKCLPKYHSMFFYFIYCLRNESAYHYCMLGVQHGCGRHCGRTTAFLAILVLVYFHTHPQHPWQHLSSGQL